MTLIPKDPYPDEPPQSWAETTLARTIAECQDMAKEIQRLQTQNAIMQNALVRFSNRENYTSDFSDEIEF